MIQKMLGSLRGTGAARILGTSVVDQVLLSGANFLVGVILIRYASDTDYGYFVLAQSAMMFFTGAQSAWINGPLAVLAPKRSEAECRRMVGAIEGLQSKLLLRLSMIAFVGLALATAVGMFSLHEAGVGLAMVLACWAGLLREYRRGVLQLYSRPHLVLAADVLYTVGLLATALMAAFGAEQKAIWAVLSLSVGGFAGGALANYFLAKDPGWEKGDARPVIVELQRLGNWAILGSMIHWSYGQGFNYLTASQLGVAAVAALNAARLLIQPTFVMAIGVKQALLPMASRWQSEQGLLGVLKHLTVVVVILLVLNLVYFGVAWYYLDWLTQDFLRKTIPNRNALVLFWGLYSLIYMVREIYFTSLMAMERFKSLTWMTAATAVVALAVMWPCITRYGTVGAVMGLLAGELLYMFAMFWMIWLGVKEQRAKPMAASG